MKTISGHSVSLKEISLSKAAKILSKFVSAENGASQVISAYLHRASASFNELNQLHKELKSLRSHKKKHKRHTIETGDDSRRVVDENDEKSTQTAVKFNLELDGSTGNQAGNVVESKKNKKQQEVESRHDIDNGVKFGEREGDGKLPAAPKNEILSGQEQGDQGDKNPGMEEGKKQKKEKKKKHKEGNCNFSSNKGVVENGQQQQKEKNILNSVEGENGGLVGPPDLQNKKKKKYEAGNKLYDEEVKIEQRKKRKNEDVEGLDHT